MPHGKNKENKAYSRLIFLNLQFNGIPWIIEHVQNATFVLTRRLILTLTKISQISFQRSANGFGNLFKEQRQMMFFDFQGQKVLLRGRI